MAWTADDSRYDAELKSNKARMKNIVSSIVKIDIGGICLITVHVR